MLGGRPRLTIRFPVATAVGKHPFPFRTRQLSPPAPMVLGGRAGGVGGGVDNPVGGRAGGGGKGAGGAPRGGGGAAQGPAGEGGRRERLGQPREGPAAVPAAKSGPPAAGARRARKR